MSAVALTPVANLASALAAFGLIAPSARAQPSGAKPPPAPVTVTEAALKEFSDRIEAPGTLPANESVDVTASVTGVAGTLHFEDGQRVAKGDVLARLAATEEEALPAEARATLVEAEKQHERAKQLAVGGAAAAAQLDEARRIRETARAPAWRRLSPASPRWSSPPRLTVPLAGETSARARWPARGA